MPNRNAKINIVEKQSDTISIAEQVGERIIGMELHPITNDLLIQTKKGISKLRVSPESVELNFGIGMVKDNITVIDHVEVEPEVGCEQG